MRKPRIGLGFRPTKHLRVYVPLNGTSRKSKKKKIENINGSFISKRFLIGAGLIVVSLYGIFGEKDIGFGLGCLAVGCALCFGPWLLGMLLSAHNKEETACAEPLKNQIYSFVLALDMGSEHQKMLHDLKIKIVSDGSKDTLSLEEAGNAFVLKLGDVCLGYTQAADTAWLDEHFSDILKIKYVYIHGGATDKNGLPRPFVVSANAELAPGVDAPTLSTVDLPPCAINGYTVKGDEVVYVSTTKKIHLSYGCGVNLSNCKAMLYEEAVNAGYTDCGNCFR